MRIDPGEDGGSGIFDRGWFAYLTIYSREQNYDSQFNPRIYVNSSDVKSVYEALVTAAGSRPGILYCRLSALRARRQSCPAASAGGGVSGPEWPGYE